MKYKKPILNKWYFRLRIEKDYLRGKGMVFQFGIFKLIKMPPEACWMSEQDYKGFFMFKRFNN